MFVQDSASLAASATVNVLTGKQFEFIPYDAAVQIGFTGSATGLVATVYAGPDLVMQEGAISTANRFPLVPDDYVLNFAVSAGTRMAIYIRNTTGGALTWFFGMRFSPLR